MLAPEEKPKLSTKPYLAATPQFKSGSSSPREFLERCLVDLTALEPKIGAFVHLNIQAARNAADASSARWRAGCPLSPIDGMPIGITTARSMPSSPANGALLRLLEYGMARSARGCRTGAEPSRSKPALNI
jgi:hypothetical protein